MTLGPGTRLGAYEILSLIGSGGMGEVYHARDTRLNRIIALKSLPVAVAIDAERLERFEREAQAVAALNHPNIVTIHSIERVDEVSFLTMELVEGRPLSEVIAKGGLPLDRLLKIAIPVTDAMAAAHQKGITHRDLKPGNIMLGEGEHAGRVKVLDFGLAKLTDSASAAPGASFPTVPITGEGKILGTVAYMSPEQAEGKVVDARSDLFSLGVILYEMATGQRPFTGDTSISIISSIVKDTPKSVTELNAALPRELARIIRHALVKDPERRYQTAKDLRNDLAELKADLDSGAVGEHVTQAPGWRNSLWLLWAAAGIVAAAVIGGYWWIRPRQPVHPAARRIEATFKQVTTQPGVSEFPSLSADGSWIVYDGNQSGNADIYLQSVGGTNAINLTKDSAADDIQPAFSPDGEHIAFRSEREGGGIFVMGRTGESVRRLTDRGFNPVWSPDGTKLLYATDRSNVLGRAFVSELWAVVVSTGEKRRIFAGDAVQPSWSPHGLRIAFWQVFSGQQVGQRDIWTIPADGGTAVPVTSDPAIDWNPVWSPDGRQLYFSSDRGGPMNLWRVAIDEKTGAPSGPFEPLTVPSSSAAHISVSADGRSIAYTSIANSKAIQRVPLDPATGTVRGAPVTIVAGSRPFTAPTPSPDGRWLAFQSLAPQLDIFVSAADGTGVRQLTNDRANDRNPTWSPDGKQIAFMSNRDGKNQIWSIRSDGSSLRRLTALESGVSSYNLLSHDGSKMMFEGQSGSDEFKLFVFDPRKEWNDQTPRVISAAVEPGRLFAEWSWSPDDQQLAGTAPLREAYTGPLFVYSFATGQFTRLNDSESAEAPIWLNDGRHILFDEGSRLLLIDIKTRATREVLSIAPDRSRCGRSTAITAPPISSGRPRRQTSGS
jgi:Tol biopolymer transport system component